MSASVQHFLNDCFESLSVFDPLSELGDIFLPDGQAGQFPLGLPIPEEIRPVLLFFFAAPATAGLLATSEINSAKGSRDRQVETNNFLFELLVFDIVRHTENISLHYIIVKIYFQAVDKKEPLAIRPVRLGGLPLVHSVAGKLDLMNILKQIVPTDPRDKIPVSQTLYAILCNIIVERFPLYKIEDWARGRELIPHEQISCLNDDRVGRALHRLFRSDRSSLMTGVILKAIQSYDLQCDRVHNDSTTVTLSGQYDVDHKAARPKRGHNKDHRPDLKQLLFSLSVCGDEAVPLYFKVWDGNVTDDTTHLRNWMALRGLLGRADFTYVADSKLCTRENMEFIASEGGFFITVLTETRGEDKTFKDWIQENTPSWQEVLRHKKENSPDSIWWAFESPFPSSEGFRILWIKSADKQRQDEESRRSKIDKTVEALTSLQSQPHRSHDRLEAAVKDVFRENHSERYFHWQIISRTEDSYKQSHRGRPRSDSTYRKIEKITYTFSWSHHQDTIRYEARSDGLFPLITNRKDTARDILGIYKYQPRLEKRHEQLKSVYHVAPVFLKHPERIEALLFLYFLALLMTALMERTVRKAMRENGIGSLPIYPEQRECRKPTADKILDLFRDVRKQTILKNNSPLEVIHDDLTVIQKQVLSLFQMKPSDFFQVRSA